MARATKRTLIHAPIETVYAAMRDIRGWRAWYAGLGELHELHGTGSKGTVARFDWLLGGQVAPLGYEIVEDGLDIVRGRIRARITGAVEGGHVMTVKPTAGVVEVRFELDMVPAGEALPLPPGTLTRIVHETVDRGLANLRMRCERARTGVEMHP